MRKTVCVEHSLFQTAAVVCLLVTLLLAGAGPAGAQQASKFDIERAHLMLRVIKDDLQKNYYDPKFHGMDLEASFKTADEKLKTATSQGQLFGIIARVLMELNDSHTFFIPPGRASRTEYGWQAQMIGEKCFVVAIKPGSDAEKKGLKPGDEVVSVDGTQLTRENIWTFGYLYHVLRPRPGIRLELVKSDGKPQQVEVMARIEQGKRVMDVSGAGSGTDIATLIREAENESRLHRHRWLEQGDDLFTWKMPEFDLSKDSVDTMFDKLKKRKALILDLRGNGGGAEETLLRMLGNLFDHDVKIGDLKAVRTRNR